MLAHCLKCRKKSESKNPNVKKTNKEWTMFLSKCTVCESKKSEFFRQKEASGFQVV